MKIVVCVKQVPDTSEVRIDPVTNTMIRDGVPSILNPEDANALEAALSIKDSNDSTQVVVLTMGPPQANVMLRQCLAMGADEAILLTDRAFAGGDTWATANVLAAAIQRIGGVDLVLAGRQAIDGDTAQVGPQIAERLGIPQVTYVDNIALCDDQLVVRHQLAQGHEVLKLKMPALLTAVKELNTPRYLSVLGICQAYERDITQWSIEDIEISRDMVGLTSSPTKVYRSFVPDSTRQGCKWEGDPSELAQQLFAELRKKHAI